MFKYRNILASFQKSYPKRKAFIFHISRRPIFEFGPSESECPLCWMVHFENSEEESIANCRYMPTSGIFRPTKSAAALVERAELFAHCARGTLLLVSLWRLECQAKHLLANLLSTRVPQTCASLGQDLLSLFIHNLFVRHFC